MTLLEVLNLTGPEQMIFDQAWLARCEDRFQQALRAERELGKQEAEYGTCGSSCGDCEHCE